MLFLGFLGRLCTPSVLPHKSDLQSLIYFAHRFCHTLCRGVHVSCLLMRGIHLVFSSPRDIALLVTTYSLECELEFYPLVMCNSYLAML